MKPQELLSIPVTISLCQELSPFQEETPFLEQFADQLEASLDDLLRDLGISGKTDISVETDAKLKPIQVCVHTAQLRYPSSMFRSILEQASGHALGQAPPDYTVSNWLKDLLEPQGMPESTGTDHKRSNIPLIADTLAQLTTAIISRQPEKLLGPEQISAFLDQGKRLFSMEKQALIDKLAPESMALFLTKLLKMRISIADSEAILTEICNALASGFKDVEIIETLICRLRPHTIDIEINPEYLRQISECSQQVTVLPVWSEDASQKIRDTFSLFSDGMFYEMGIRVPAIRFIPNYKFAENTFALRINHLRSHPLQGLRISQILVNESPQYLAEFGIQTAIPLRNPSNNRDNSLVEAEQRANLEDQGIFTWDAIGYIVLVLANEIRHAAGCLVDSEGVEYDMAMIDQAFPQLVAAAMEIYSTAQLAGVFRGLLMEGLPIRDMRSILERLLHYDYAFSDDPSKYIFFGDRLVLHQAFQSEEIFGLNNLIQYARSGLKEYISHKYTYGRGQSRLNVYLLDSELEKRLVEHVTHSGDHDTQKLLTPEAVEMIFQELRSMLSPLPPPTKMPVILTTTSIRFFLRDLLAPEFPELQVLAFEELSPLTEITPIDKISIAA